VASPRMFEQLDTRLLLLPPAWIALARAICETEQGPDDPDLRCIRYFPPVAASPNRNNMKSQPVSDQMALLRIVDAAANRTREGLRTIEDWVRFALDDAHLTECLKTVRHDLAAALAPIPWEQRLAARDTQADVGTGIATPSEYSRQTPADILTANFLRLQEGLRSLEEYGKIIDPAVGAAIEQLRYRIYTLHRAVDATQIGQERLAAVRLYVLLDGRATVEDFQRMAAGLIEAGVDLLQLRDKRLTDRELIDRAHRLRRLARGTSTLVIINDRPDLAVLALADGVHLGQDDLSVKDARSIVGPKPLVGVSTHSIEQARQAVLDGASYLGVGPTFPSGTKRFDHFPGIDLLRKVAAEIRLPAFAIGGITRDNLHQVKSAGFSRAAVSGAVLGAGDSVQAVREFAADLRTEK
jgi:thiamine-phosphate pyrophosphorylase